MFKFAIPLLVFIALAVFLAIGLSLNPREIPSPLIGKPAPVFSAPKLHEPDATLSPVDLKGRVWLLNVWASWCISCRAEHPVLNRFAQQKKIYMVGLNYKDETSDAKNWLNQLGNPYDVSVVDQDGRIGIDWGVYGVPETFIVDKNGLIRYKHTGPVTAEDLEIKLLPLISQLQGEPA
ncbi:MAG: DsbE family thiol:disulfide interchange protein [Methylobacter sp.]|nr:MAG: DsbE family thiol:disulfide interchange protein [Methylobacter sp.]PPD21103.1 MAG: DsbE family thiol:disulfide interchange protein [Methylobacter sp.]